MPQNTTLSITSGTWTLLTNSNVTTMTFQNVGSNHIMIKGTVGATPPSDYTGAIRYNPGQGERNVSLADLFPGVSGANRVYAWAESATPVVVSHA